MKVSQEPEALDQRALYYGLLGMLAAIAAGTLAAWWLMRPYAAGAVQAGASGSRSYRAMSEVNDMETSLFRAEPALRPDLESAERRLAGYGWIDRERGIVHIPIERAMELYLEAARRPAEPAPAEEERP